jgi:hypothetical protein
MYQYMITTEDTTSTDTDAGQVAASLKSSSRSTTLYKIYGWEIFHSKTKKKPNRRLQLP